MTCLCIVILSCILLKIHEYTQSNAVTSSKGPNKLVCDKSGGKTFQDKHRPVGILLKYLH